MDLVLISLPQRGESLIMLMTSTLVALNIDYQITIVHFFECVVDTSTPLLLITCLSIYYLTKSIKRFQEIFSVKCIILICSNLALR